MSFETFESRIKNRFGNAIFMRENGKHIAKLEGITITGNTFSNRVTVKWGSGHVAMADL